MISMFILPMGSCSAAAGVASQREVPWEIKVVAAAEQGAASSAVREKAGEFVIGISEQLGHSPSGPYVIYITPDRKKYYLQAGADAPEWAVAIYSDRKIVISPEGLLTDEMNFYNTLEHELVHAVLDHYFRKRTDALPRWLNEGLAVVISDSWEIPQLWSRRKTVLYASLKQGRALDFEEISGGFPRSEIMAELAYMQSADFVRYLVNGRDGWDRMRRLLKNLSDGVPREEAFRKIYRKDFEDLVIAWEEDVKRPGALVWVMHVLVNFDLYLWGGLVVLVVVVFLLVKLRRGRPGPPAGPGRYDPEDDWDDLDEEWDPDFYGYRPWRPGKNQ